MSFPSLPPPLRHLLPHRYRRRSHRRRLNLMLYLISTILLLLTPLYLIYKPSFPLIKYLSHRYPSVLWHVPSSLLPLTVRRNGRKGGRMKIVALTIDDAPSEYTEGILDVLAEFNATATFFVIGSQVEGREEVLRRAVDMGCELGNHAMYDSPSKDLSDEQLSIQIHLVEGKLQDIYNTSVANNNTPQDSRASARSPPRYFRPGSGFFSTRMLALLDSLGYKLVLGSIYPHDPQIPYWRVNAAHVLSMLRPGGIVVVHDRRGWTVAMLRRVLGEGRSRGWKFVSLSELLGVAGMRDAGGEGESGG